MVGRPEQRVSLNNAFTPSPSTSSSSKCTMLWLRRLANGSSPQRSGFAPRPNNMGLTERKWQWDEIFLRVLWFAILIVPPKFYTLILFIWHRRSVILETDKNRTLASLSLSLSLSLCHFPFQALSFLQVFPPESCTNFSSPACLSQVAPISSFLHYHRNYIFRGVEVMQVHIMQSSLDIITSSEVEAFSIAPHFRVLSVNNFPSK